MIHFALSHLTELVGALALCWGLFSLGRLWEREHPVGVIFTPSQEMEWERPSAVRFYRTPYDRDHEL